MAQQNAPAPTAKDVRQHVIDVASDMFFHMGIRSVTMDDIAHKLTMSKRTLYQIFADKEALLLATAIKHDEEERERLERLSLECSNVLELLIVVFEKKMREMDEVCITFLNDLMKYPSLVAHYEKTRKAQEVEAVKFLDRGKEQGLFRKDVRFPIVVRQISAGMEMVIKNGFLEDYSQAEIFLNTVIPYIRGCATKKGIDMIDSFLSRYEQAQETNA